MFFLAAPGVETYRDIWLYEPYLENIGPPLSNEGCPVDVRPWEGSLRAAQLGQLRAC